jgi:transcriptional regulator GlxA family with amidase domain
VLADVPGHEIVFVGEAGPVSDHTGHCPLVASMTFAEVTAPDVVVVPGELAAEWDDRLVQWLRQVHPTTTWTTSVCTGSLYLAAAGILDGVDATTHWARTEQLERLGARYTEQRVVARGKVITAAGVSSGTDMALTLLDRMYGPAVAQTVQLAIEYDPSRRSMLAPRRKPQPTSLISPRRRSTSPLRPAHQGRDDLLRARRAQVAGTPSRWHP